MRAVILLLRALSLVLLLLFLCVLADTRAIAQVPEAAYQYQRQATAVYRDVFGLDAPISALAGQVHQESLWQSDAESAYAAGLTQFTPDTAADMARWYVDLAPADPYDPRWALLAQATYMHRLGALSPASGAASEYETYGMSLSAYNGGLGWLRRDAEVCSTIRGCDASRWFGGIEHTPDPRRAEWAVNENRHYTDVIMRRHQYLYETAGWGRAIYPCD